MTDLETTIEKDRQWLVTRPDFRGDSWGEIKNWLTDCLTEWWKEYCDELDLQQDNLFRTAALVRMWKTWNWHWHRCWEIQPRTKDIPGTGKAVADLLREGRRPTNANHMGGDPLFECVIVECILSRTDVCFQRVQGQVEKIFMDQASRWNDVPSSDDVHDFCVKLCGFDKPSSEAHEAGIARFSGHSSLRVWLRRVAHNFLVDRYRRRKTGIEAAYRRAVEGTQFDTPATDTATDYSLLIAKYAAQAFKQLDARSKMVLLLKVREQWPNREIAQTLKVSEGNASRLANSAARHFGDNFRRVAKLDTASREIDVVLERDSPWLAQVLMDQITNAESDQNQ